MDKVVKCNSEQCAKFFMHTKEDIKCPFCHTKYIEVVGIKSEKKPEEKPKEKKITIKTQKESFKIWKND